MNIPVLIEPISTSLYRARSGEPLILSAEGKTPDEAIDNLKGAMRHHLQNGKQLVSVELTSPPSANDPVNPWLAVAGIHDPNDPLIQRWQASMAEYRDEVENDPGRP